MTRFINPASAPKPVGPYSSACLLENGFLFLSGQIGLNPKTGEMAGNTISEQTTQILNNIKNILTEMSYSISDIIKVVVYLKDISKFSEFNNLYEKFLGNHKPIRTTVEVSNLPKDALIEIEVTCFHQK